MGGTAAYGEAARGRARPSDLRAAVAGKVHGPALLCSRLLRALEANGPAVRRALVQAYGGGSAGLREDRRQACWRAVQRFLECYGDRRVRVFRVPARIALNPHCEHQGAWVPYGTHRRELIAVVGARHGDLFTLTNVDPGYRERVSFRLRDEVEFAADAWRRGWGDYIEDPWVARRREALADPKERLVGRTGSINFVKAAALRLSREARSPVCGADIVINGDIPIGVGQSSSSALVVAVALALNELWELQLSPAALVAICGEAEWYVGTRGGSGDHAAMLLGSASGLVGMRFEPPVKLLEARPMPLPPDCQLIIANSGQRAIKNKEERRQFNAGIFAYRFALLYLREAVRLLAEELELTAEQQEARFLADVNGERFPLHTIYRLLLAVPEVVSPHELLGRYREAYEAGAKSCFGTADPAELPQSIPIRGAALYGLGRVDRGLAMQELCAQGDRAAMQEFGRLMYITHDGDRVSCYDPRQGHSAPYRANLAGVTDARIEVLLEAAASSLGSAGWQSAQLRYQPGFYGASTSGLDRIVDLVRPLPGVLGAGLMGAGGGGCVLVLARAGEEALTQVRSVLAQGYYEPLGKAVDVEVWHPVAPAGELQFAPAGAPDAWPGPLTRRPVVADAAGM